MWTDLEDRKDGALRRPLCSPVPDVQLVYLLHQPGEFTWRICSCSFRAAGAVLLVFVRNPESDSGFIANKTFRGILIKFSDLAATFFIIKFV